MTCVRGVRGWASLRKGLERQREEFGCFPAGDGEPWKAFEQGKSTLPASSCGESLAAAKRPGWLSVGRLGRRGMKAQPQQGGGASWRLEKWGKKLV